MRKSTGLILVLITVLSGPVLAVEDAPQGRYSMTATDNGMLRLDTQTGAVSLCAGTAGHWVCRSIADDRLALENEIDRLSNENQRLKAELEQRRSEAKPDVPYEAKPDVTPEVQLEPDALGSWRPSDEDIDEFMTFFEKIMNRFKQFAESMKDDSPKQQP
jgi:hypothetical protein